METNISDFKRVKDGGALDLLDVHYSQFTDREQSPNKKIDQLRKAFKSAVQTAIMQLILLCTRRKQNGNPLYDSECYTQEK